MIAVSADNRTINVTNEDASALLIGVYIDRAMTQSVSSSLWTNFWQNNANETMQCLIVYSFLRSTSASERSPLACIMFNIETFDYDFL